MSERVTLWIDLRNTSDALLEVGHYLGTQGITDYTTGEGESYIGIQCLELSEDDAFIVKMRFPIVSDSEMEKYKGDRLYQSALLKAQMMNFQARLHGNAFVNSGSPSPYSNQTFRNWSANVAVNAAPEPKGVLSRLKAWWAR